MTWFANGAGVQIETTSGTDYLFASNAKAEGTAPERQAIFHGQAAAIQVRAKQVTLTLGSAGRTQRGQRLLESPKATARSAARSILVLMRGTILWKDRRGRTGLDRYFLDGFVFASRH